MQAGEFTQLPVQVLYKLWLRSQSLEIVSLGQFVTSKIESLQQLSSTHTLHYLRYDATE